MLVQVTVYDDGLPVTELKTIHITLILRGPSGSDDIFRNTADLIVVPQGKQLTVMCHAKELIVMGLHNTLSSTPCIALSMHGTVQILWVCFITVTHLNTCIAPSLHGTVLILL